MLLDHGSEIGNRIVEKLVVFAEEEEEEEEEDTELLGKLGSFMIVLWDRRPIFQRRRSRIV